MFCCSKLGQNGARLPNTAQQGRRITAAEQRELRLGALPKQRLKLCTFISFVRVSDSVRGRNRGRRAAAGFTGLRPNEVASYWEEVPGRRWVLSPRGAVLRINSVRLALLPCRLPRAGDLVTPWPVKARRGGGSSGSSSSSSSGSSLRCGEWCRVQAEQVDRTGQVTTPPQLARLTTAAGTTCLYPLHRLVVAAPRHGLLVGASVQLVPKMGVAAEEEEAVGEQEEVGEGGGCLRPQEVGVVVELLAEAEGARLVQGPRGDTCQLDVTQLVPARLPEVGWRVRLAAGVDGRGVLEAEGQLEEGVVVGEVRRRRRPRRWRVLGATGLVASFLTTALVAVRPPAATGACGSGMELGTPVRLRRGASPCFGMGSITYDSVGVVRHAAADGRVVVDWAEEMAWHGVAEDLEVVPRQRPAVGDRVRLAPYSVMCSGEDKLGSKTGVVQHDRPASYLVFVVRMGQQVLGFREGDLLRCPSPDTPATTKPASPSISPAPAMKRRRIATRAVTAAATATVAPASRPSVTIRLPKASNSSYGGTRTSEGGGGGGSGGDADGSDSESSDVYEDGSDSDDSVVVMYPHQTTSLGGRSSHRMMRECECPCTTL